MAHGDFPLKWERDDKFKLLEQVENAYDESLWNEAVEQYKEALAKQPDHPEMLYHYGYLLELKAIRLLREAAACYEKGLASGLIDQGYAWLKGKLNAQLIRAQAHLLENMKSVEYYKQELSKRPDDPDVYCYLVQCYLHVDQAAEAQKVVEAGLKLFPRHAILHYYQGEICARMGRVEEALQSWERSANFDPQFIDGRFSRAFLFEREQRLEEAAEEWKKIIVFLDQHNFNADYPKQELVRIQQQLNSADSVES
jgi:tetratricopeptide (TPR) repeat protein